MTAMFERFTEKAIKVGQKRHLGMIFLIMMSPSNSLCSSPLCVSQVVMLAQEEARRLGHNFVGTEQILLGLIGEGTGIAAKVLKSVGVNLKDARVEVKA